MEGLWASFGIGFVAGLRSMTATAALAWAASLGRTRTDLIPAGPDWARALTEDAVAAGLAAALVRSAPRRGRA